MTTLALPTLTKKNATQCALSLQYNTQTFESPLNKSVQTYELPGARWNFAATWENMIEADARIFKAWLATMRGQAGRFYAGDLSRKTPRGIVSGSGTVRTVTSAGATSLSSAWTPINQTGWFLVGDYIQVNNELKIITADATTNSLGYSTLYFEPALRSALTIGMTITYTNCVATFKLNDDGQDKINFDPERHPSLTISATEVFV